MIDLNLLREQQDAIACKILKKDPAFPVNRLIELDRDVRLLKTSVEALRQKKNECADAAKKGVTPELREQSTRIGKELKELEERLVIAQEEFDVVYLRCPNIPTDDVPEGNKESNVVVRTVGQKPYFDFPVRHHVELGAMNDWFDLERGAKIAASNFILYKQAGAQVIYALTRFMMKNNMKHGFELWYPPYMVNSESLVVTGNFPKFKDEVFSIMHEDLFAIPTAEVPLTNIYRDEILEIKDLPKRMTAWTSCFRREAGGYGRNERGLIRIHQFEKVELVVLCEPDKSAHEQERMIACAEEMLKELGLHYRVSLLAAQDCSFASAKTYDIEVWLPGQNAYYEVSSASNCTDFQSRRGKIRYRKTATDKPQLVHTLNASAIALSRLMVALLETYQKEDGSIDLPACLKREML